MNQSIVETTIGCGVRGLCCGCVMFVGYVVGALCCGCETICCGFVSHTHNLTHTVTPIVVSHPQHNGCESVRYVVGVRQQLVACVCVYTGVCVCVCVCVCDRERSTTNT